MTKIKNYPLDLEVNGGDKWIGTDSQSLAKLTKNFTPDNLAKYYNDKEVVESVNQLRFFYDTVDPGDDRASGSFSFQTEVGPTVPFSSISSLVFSKYTMGNDAVNSFMTDIVNSIIIIQKADNPNIYAFYALNSYEIDPLDGAFYNVVLTYSSGTGSIEEDQDYFVSLIQFAGAAGIQTILGSEFIDSSLTGIGEVTLSLSATGDSTSLTGLRGDNTWGTLGLEALDEGNGTGWRLIGRDPANYGNIGLNATDLSISNSASSTKGSIGTGSLTLGLNNENPLDYSIVSGINTTITVTNPYHNGNFITGENNTIYNNMYNNIIGGFRNTIGTNGATLEQAIVYDSIAVGDNLNMYAARNSGMIGQALSGGSVGATIVGVANVDLTTSIANAFTANFNNYGPRFIVGTGIWNPQNNTGTRANGFVVMSDGTATFPELSNALIDSAGADSAVTKGWVEQAPVILTAPDLSKWQLTVDNAGNLSTTLIP